MQNSTIFREILSSEGAVLYEVETSGLSYVTSGTLQLYLSVDGLLLMKLNSDFEYGIDPHYTIKYDDRDPQYQRVFFLHKFPKGTWVLKVNQNCDEIQSCLREKANLVSKDASKNTVNCYQGKRNQCSQKERVSNNNKKSDAKERRVMDVAFESYSREEYVGKNKEVEVVKESSSKGWSLGGMVRLGTKYLGEGLTIGGAYLSKGLEKTGSYIATKVQPGQKKVQISQNARDNLKLAGKTTGNILTFTGKQVGNLFNLGKEVASDVGERLQKTEMVQNAQKNPYYETVKEAGKTTVVAASNVLSGLVTAVYSVGSGLANGATKVINKKYGEEAAQAADGAFQTAGNVGKLMRVPIDQAYNTFKD